MPNKIIPEQIENMLTRLNPIVQIKVDHNFNGDGGPQNIYFASSPT